MGNDGTITIDIGDINVDYTSDVGSTITISDGTFHSTTFDTDWISNDGTFTYNSGYVDNSLSRSTIERMCKEYPALKQVWEKFIVIYDMCEKDYQGKIKAGELDDDIPF